MLALPSNGPSGCRPGEDRSCQPINPIGRILDRDNRKLNHHRLITKWVQRCQARHAKMDARPYRCSESSARPLLSTAPPHLPRVSIMTDKSKQPKRRDGAILSLDVAIGLVNIGKEASSATPAPAVFGVATILLTTIRVSFTPSVNGTSHTQT